MDNNISEKLKYFKVSQGSNFRIVWSPKTEKYAVENLNTGNITDFFIDNIAVMRNADRDFPFDRDDIEPTWTSNYFCGKINGYYYIIDCDGTLSLKSTEPYVVCRNVIVGGARKEDSNRYIGDFVINKEMKKCENYIGQICIYVDKYNCKYAMLRYPNNTIQLFDADGETSVLFVNVKQALKELSRHSFVCRKTKLFGPTESVLLDKEFKIISSCYM